MSFIHGLTTISFAILSGLFELISMESLLLLNSVGYDLSADSICRLRCISGCFENTKNIDQCESTCVNEAMAKCISTDVACWETCDGKMLHQIGNMSRPKNFNVSYYALNGEPNPWEAYVSWQPVEHTSLYLIQFYEIQNSSYRVTGGPYYKITNETQIVIRKHDLCSVYRFRLAAFNSSAVSQLHKEVDLSKPVPVVNNLNLTIVSALYKPKRLHRYKTGREDNGTFIITVSYRVPDGWNISRGDIMANFSKFLFLRADDFHSDIFETPYPRHDKDGLPRVYYEMSGAAAKVDFRVYFMVEAIMSICGTVYFPPSWMNGMTYSSNCVSEGNVSCKSSQPRSSSSCNLPLNITIEAINEKIEFIPVHFSLTSTDAVNLSEVTCYAFTFYTIDSTSDAAPVVQFDNAQFLHNKTLCKHPTDDAIFPLNFTFVDIFTGGQMYGVQMCALYSPDDKMGLQLATPHTLDLRHIVTISKHRQKRIIIIAIVAGFLLISFVLGFAGGATILIIRRRRIARKKENTIVTVEQENETIEAESNINEQPTAFVELRDQWEIDPDCIIIDETQKLGEGAFGTVYKGKLIRKPSSISDYADYIDCDFSDVAIKMIPDYADELSKSEFKKEINLMKKLGYNERLVNMIACIVTKEPLCLIAEYCSDGDLLHYLRHRRSYMIELENNDIDLSNLDAMIEYVDLEMILCLKDLISFAWQVCVGLEYLWLRKFIHRDVAARNILVSKGKKAKIGDFGLCRYSCRDPVYIGKGGKLPIKWMSIEAIKNYEFTSWSDVWSFGVLLFELITLGGSPYPSVQPADMESVLESGQRMEKPDNCPEELYQIMLDTWEAIPKNRPNCSQLRERLRHMLESFTEDYFYLKLNGTRDYYNVVSHEYPISQPDIDKEQFGRTSQFVKSGSDCATDTSKAPVSPRSAHANNPEVHIFGTNEDQKIVINIPDMSKLSVNRPLLNSTQSCDSAVSSVIKTDDSGRSTMVDDQASPEFKTPCVHSHKNNCEIHSLRNTEKSLVKSASASSVSSPSCYGESIDSSSDGEVFLYHNNDRQSATAAVDN